MWNVFIITPYIVLSQKFSSNVQNIVVLACAVAGAWMFLSLREGEVWMFSGLMVLWDIFAVNSRMGPINIIIHTRQHWIYMGEEFDMPPGLTYRSEDGFELGTGDIIFYGLLVGRSMLMSYATLFSSILAILVGFVLTALYTIRIGRTVPALPVAMTIGVVVYVLVSVLNIQLMMTEFISRGFYV
jgi:hypothetical protein